MFLGKSRLLPTSYLGGFDPGLDDISEKEPSKLFKAASFLFIGRFIETIFGQLLPPSFFLLLHQ